MCLKQSAKIRKRKVIYKNSLFCFLFQASSERLLLLHGCCSGIFSRSVSVCFAKVLFFYAIDFVGFVCPSLFDAPLNVKMGLFHCLLVLCVYS